MTEGDILKVVEKAFDETLLECSIEGREEFFEKLKDKLKILCDQDDIYNNLSK